jgi:outer membrane immunogenic protein
MRKFLLASVSALAVAAAGAASAADMAVKAPPPSPPPPAAFSWTGCYGGAHVGWGWGKSQFTDHSYSNIQVGHSGNHYYITSSAGLISSSQGENGLATASVTQSGAIFGGQVGCDYQFGGGSGTNWVVGISGSVAGADINGSDLDPYYLPFRISGNNSGASGMISANTDFLADVSGRLGFTWGQALIYGKGGFAWAHNKYVADTNSGYDNIGFNHIDATSAFTASDSVTGAVAGAGVEWAFLQNWSVFAEYDHYFFGTKTLDFTGRGFYFVPLTFSALVDVKQDIDTVKVGLNYRFHY